MKYIIAAIALILPAMASAEAFGIKVGTPISQIAGAKASDTKYVYRIDKAPVHNQQADFYLITATPQTGVCAVSMLGETYENDRYGSTLKQRFEQVKSALIGLYGSSNDFDFLKSQALWDGQDEFVMSLRQDERTLASFWTADNGSSLPATTSGIMLEAKALNSSDSYISLRYEFSNFDECKTHLERADAAGF